MRKKTHDEFVHDLKEIHGDEYTPIDEYKTALKKMRFRHNKCGRIIEATPNNLLRRMAGCRPCGRMKFAEWQTLSQEMVDERVKSIVGDEYVFLEEYRGSNTKIMIKHNACGHEYLVTPGNFFSGRRCPKCKSSNGEDFIAEWLVENNLYFEREVTFPNCRYKQPLRFDFKVYLNDRNWVLIEFDGEQHFKHGCFKDSEGVTQIRDEIKNKFCADNDIKLHRIPYTFFDRKGALNKKLRDVLNEICFLSSQSSTTMESAA